MKKLEELTKAKKAKFWWHTKHSGEELRTLSAKLQNWERTWLDTKELKGDKMLDWCRIRETLANYYVAKARVTRDLNQITEYLDK